MTYRTEFPDFDPADMPAIPEGFEDTSWGVENCPSIGKGDVRVFIDYADASKREFPEVSRFSVHKDGELVIDSDDWNAILTTLAEIDALQGKRMFRVYQDPETFELAEDGRHVTVCGEARFVDVELTTPVAMLGVGNHSYSLMNGTDFTVTRIA